MRVGLPAAHAPHIHVNEVGSAIVAHSSAMQAQRGIPKGGRRNPWQANVDRFCLHVKTVAGHARVRASRTQELVAPGRAVSADHINFTARIVERSGQVVEHVEQARIEMVYLSRAMVAEIMVEFIERMRQIGIAAAVNDIETLAGMGVIKVKAVFACRRDN